MVYESGPATAPRPPRKGKKYFSLAEANRALPYVARIIDDIVKCYQEAVDLRRRLEQTPPDGDAQDLKDNYEQRMDQLNAFVEELQQVGVELKDFERGLIDFPAIFQGREVYLCWHRGEQSISAWHEIDSGFAGRQDVAMLDSDQES